MTIQAPSGSRRNSSHHGPKPDKYQRILDLIGRERTFTELGIFSAMWNDLQASFGLPMTVR
ncbi:hypothetical protein GUK30_15390 [Rhizobium leguminosarum]|jgi:phosphoribosylformylglycinamidine (FGAM) synthase-like enzyme|uniref:hypothetical protein n=1 Tax=Rhizobium ruizarguesonis TaxID=2081791 RepID=UPI0013BACDC2|nr:hypothetical protein [Rhizobium ruizarguesonis]NEH63326.1 hypothetical protein [Rhizobium ruizarguesonis]NEI20794.1 hypothetical protein [Rhizobium ruizarguesonis]